jgi:hypothetical protein
MKPNGESRSEKIIVVVANVGIYINESKLLGYIRK